MVLMQKKTKILIATIILILVLAVFFNFKKSNDSQGQEFNLGLISIMTGEYAVVGQNYANGVILANDLYNAEHPEAKINLFVEDDGFNGGKGVSAYQKLVNVNKVQALINASTPTIDSIYETVSKTDMPVIQGGEQSREPANDNVFGIFPNSIDSEYDYGAYMRNKGVKEMTLIYTNHDAMIRFVDAFKRGFKGKTTDFKIPADEKDFRTHALKVAGTKPAYLGFFIFPQQGAQFLKEYFKIDKSKPQFFFDASFQSGFSDYQRILGDLAPLTGTLVGTINLPTTQEFKDAYKKRFGTDAGFLADIGYDAFNILATTHSSDPKKWIADIKNINMAGASGTIKFGPTGNRLPDTKVMTIKDGKLSDL